MNVFPSNHEKCIVCLFVCLSVCLCLLANKRVHKGTHIQFNWEQWQRVIEMYEGILFGPGVMLKISVTMILRSSIYPDLQLSISAGQSSHNSTLQVATVLRRTQTSLSQAHTTNITSLQLFTSHRVHVHSDDMLGWTTARTIRVLRRVLRTDRQHYTRITY